jgi:uncharacterized membrane-anchored protein
VTRVSVSPRRNVDAPLVEIDQSAAWYVRLGQRVFGAYIWALVAYFIIGTLLLLLIGVVLGAHRA